MKKYAPILALLAALAPVQAEAAIAFNWCNATANGTTVTTTTVSNGANTVANNDLLVAVISAHNATDTASVPTISGWTCPAGLTFFNSNDGPNRVAVCYKIAASESFPQTVTWGGTSVSNAIASLCDWSGANTSTPLDISGGSSNTTSSTSITAASVSPTGSADLLIGVFMNEGGKGPYTKPASMTLRQDNNSGSSSIGEMLVADQQLAASGATGTRVATMTTSDASEGFLLAITPSGGGGATAKQHNMMLLGVE